MRAGFLCNELLPDSVAGVGWRLAAARECAAALTILESAWELLPFDFPGSGSVSILHRGEVTLH